MNAINTLYKRQFAMMAGMILISFALLGTAFLTLSSQYIRMERKLALERNAESIAAYTAESFSRMEILGNGLVSDKYKLYLTSAADISDANILVCYPSESILLAWPSMTLSSPKLPADVVEKIAIDGGYTGMTTLGGIFPEQRLVAAKPIMLATLTANGSILEQQFGTVLVAADASSITALWSAFAKIFFFTAVVVLCIAFISTSVTSLRLTQPLKEMTVAARKFGHGEFDIRVDTDDRKDEIGELAVSFNAMADSLAKAEAKRSEFVANISHELKTPMTTIAGFADGILDGTIPPERETDALRTISSETRRLSRLVRSMLDLSRLQSAENVTAQERFDVNEILVRVLLSLETKINARSLDVDTHLPEESVMVWGDPDAITQVCYNLLDNAIKFSPEGGVITLTIAPDKAGKANISIRNQGETIPPEEAALLFERFHKSDKSRSEDREGVGLGLYIVKTILNNHKENISVTSEDGVTQFTFTLTLA